MSKQHSLWQPLRVVVRAGWRSTLHICSQIINAVHSVSKEGLYALPGVSRCRGHCTLPGLYNIIGLYYQDLPSNIRISSLLLNGSTGITIRHVQGCARKPEATEALHTQSRNRSKRQKQKAKTERHPGFAGDSSSHYWLGASGVICRDRTGSEVCTTAMNVP